MFGFGDYTGRPNKPVNNAFAQGQQGARVTSKYNRPADTQLFQQRQKDFQQFQKQTGGTGNVSGTVPKIGGRNMLAVRDPQLTAVQPTFRQAAGDFMRGIGNFASAVGSKVGPLSFIPGGNFISQMLQGGQQGIKDFFTPTGTVAPAPIIFGGRDSGGIDPMMNMQTEEYHSLNATQQSIYDMLIKEGKSHAEAYAQAKAHSSPKAEGYMPDYATGFKSGGIATL